MSKKETGIEQVDMQSDELSSIDESVFKIRYWNTTYTFDRISQLYKKRKFVIPDLQRAYVWTQDMASRLIDSILLGIPLPNFFIYKNEDDTNDIIDGLQRIITISTFINEENLPDKKVVFKLSNNNSVSSKWRGKSFDELTSEEQDRLRDGEANIVFFEQRFPSTRKNDIKKHVFERINTGGVKLTSQEIRNALYPGDLMEKIKELSARWSKLERRFTEKDYKKYKIDELILRIITVDSIVSNNYEGLVRNNAGKIIRSPISTSIILKNQLDCFMEKYQSGYKDIDIFDKALTTYYSDEYQNFLGRNKNNINAVYAETVFILLMSAIRSGERINFTEKSYDKIKNLDSDKKLPFTRRTTNISNLRMRIEIFKEILSGD
ncbi:MAG: DUF262 domain-containing protein [Streptococcus halitosis]|uniref:DUF262 domain-containing protein n=1 Tax=Streptococcus halitosis TaxID=2172545 RepID=A0A426FUG7_9STRE|nr:MULTISPECIES: DUF262 domain-containing protein [Streptococcus]NIB85422.1 DUF262 domain-containing protein [Streptococcus sp. CCUG 71758]MCY7092589.1 DUF262 domain-containing protein [Streptococcus oralis]ORO36986.1 hypothetical protein B7730_01425 [Streptococcus oralis subsp. tigurinus]ORO50167.1 hypothetical protein B7724_00790 [Streptococcus oralis subsp. tigurinus]RRN46352.1 DUF262 domain-containing protein [Streptococcus halitosis]